MCAAAKFLRRDIAMTNDNIAVAIIAVVIILIAAALAYHQYQKAAAHAHHTRALKGAAMKALAKALSRKPLSAPPAAQYDYQSSEGRFCAADLGEHCW